MRKSKSNTRDLGISGNGKGDKSRVSDIKAYRSAPIWDAMGPDKKLTDDVHAVSATRHHQRGSSDS